MPVYDSQNSRLFYIRNDPKDKNRLFEWDFYWRRERVHDLPGDIFSIRPIWGDRRFLVALRHKNHRKNLPDLSSLGIWDPSSRHFSYLISPTQCIFVSPTATANRGRVVFNSDHEGQAYLYETSLMGGWIRRFSRQNARFYSPMFAPNGRITYLKRDMFGFHIVIAQPNGIGERILATFDWAENPFPVPSGNAIVFTAIRKRGLEPQLYRIDLNSLKILNIPTPYGVYEPFVAKKCSAR